MNATSRDAKGFVSGIVSYIKREGKGASIPKAKFLLEKISNEARRQHRAQLETAVALNALEQRAFSDALNKATGHPVELEVTVNPALIAGYKITIADWVVDTSFAQQLKQMKTMLKTI